MMEVTKVTTIEITEIFNRDDAAEIDTQAMQDGARARVLEAFPLVDDTQVKVQVFIRDEQD